MLHSSYENYDNVGSYNLEEMMQMQLKKKHKAHVLEPDT